MKNSNYFRTGSYPGLTYFELYFMWGFLIPKRVDYIGFNDPLLILAKNERNIKRPQELIILLSVYKFMLLRISHSKYSPPYPTILLKYFFSIEIIFYLKKIFKLINNI